MRIYSAELQLLQREKSGCFFLGSVTWTTKYKFYEERMMKKMIFICAGLLLFLSNSIFAENHTSAALEHANAAAVNGEAGQTPTLLEHTKAALNHTLAASKEAKSVPKTHLDAAAKELQEAKDLANLGHVGSATTHAEAAVKHIEIGNKYNKYIGSVASSPKH
jgi:hypothetical protein